MRAAKAVSFGMIIMVLAAVVSCASEIDLMWETNILAWTDAPCTNITDLAQSPDGTILLWSGDYYAMGRTSVFMIVGADGSLLFKETVTGEEGDFYSTAPASGPLNGMFHVSHRCSTNDSNTYHFYEPTNGTYSVTEISSAGALHVPRATGSSPYLYETDGSTIRQYRIQTEPNIVADSMSGYSQDNFLLKWQSVNGIQYNIQSSQNMITWTNIGFPIIGTGGILSWSEAMTSTQQLFRVVEE